MEKIYIFATVHVDENKKVTTLLDTFSDFESAKDVAYNNIAAQRIIEKHSILGEIEYGNDINSYVPTFEFQTPKFLVKTISSFKKNTVETYRAIFECELK